MYERLIKFMDKLEKTKPINLPRDVENAVINCYDAIYDSCYSEFEKLDRKSIEILENHFKIAF